MPGLRCLFQVAVIPSRILIVLCGRCLGRWGWMWILIRVLGWGCNSVRLLSRNKGFAVWVLLRVFWGRCFPELLMLLGLVIAFLLQERLVLGRKRIAGRTSWLPRVLNGWGFGGLLFWWGILSPWLLQPAGCGRFRASRILVLWVLGAGSIFGIWLPSKPLPMRKGARVFPCIWGWSLLWVWLALACIFQSGLPLRSLGLRSFRGRQWNFHLGNRLQ